MHLFSGENTNGCDLTFKTKNQIALDKSVKNNGGLYSSTCWSDQDNYYYKCLSSVAQHSDVKFQFTMVNYVCKQLVW